MPPSSFCHPHHEVLNGRLNFLPARAKHIPLGSLEDGVFDDPLGQGSGAAVIFGNTGGVMEAALRTAYELAAGVCWSAAGLGWLHPRYYCWEVSKAYKTLASRYAKPQIPLLHSEGRSKVPNDSTQRTVLAWMQ